MDENSKGLWIGLALMACGAVGGGLYWNYAGRPAALKSPPAIQAAPEEPAAVSSALLPKLEESDNFLRDRLKSLAFHAQWARWLLADNLLRRLTAAAAIIAEAKSPRDSLKFLAPEKSFTSKKRDAQVFMDVESYARYDLVAAVIESMSAQAAVSAFQDLKPLFNQAYQELGGPDQDFQDTLVRAINVLLGTPSVAGEIQLRKRVISYAMADEKLESLSAAQKHLLRMGPRNLAKIQAKLREFALSLGVSETKLRQPQVYP